MSPPASSNMTASPESSRNESQKSIITRLFSHRANESSPSESATRITERNMMSEKNRLRTISRNVLSAMLNMFFYYKNSSIFSCIFTRSTTFAFLAFLGSRSSVESVGIR